MEIELTLEERVQLYFILQDHIEEQGMDYPALVRLTRLLVDAGVSGSTVHVNN